MIKYGAFGIVSEVEPGRAKVYLEEDGIVTKFLPVLVRKSQSDKESWQLEINEHVVCLMDENFNEGVIIGAIPNDIDTPDPDEAPGKFRKKFSDGTEIEYDKNTGKLTVDVQGELIAKASISAKVEAPSITITGNVNISGVLSVSGALTAASISTTGGGSITASGNMTVSGSISSTGDVVAAGKSLSTHVHGGVQTGGGTTSPPV